MNVEGWIRLAENWFNESALWPVLVAVAALAALTAIRWTNRNRLVIQPFSVDDDRLKDAYDTFSKLVESELRLVFAIHQSMTEAAADASLFHEMAPHTTAEDLVVSVMPGKFSQVGKGWLGALGFLFAPPRVEGRIDTDGDGITVRATLFPRGGAPRELDMIRFPAGQSGSKNELAHEFAMRLVVLLTPEAEVTTWSSLDALTEALRVWPQRFELSDQEFSQLEGILERARAHDPGSAFINYSLGLLRYSQYDADENAVAFGLFEKAMRTTDVRLQGLASLGAARCLCQDYHRFGRQTEDVLSSARRLAETSVDQLGSFLRERGRSKGNQQRARMDYLRALFCRAFAYHVTERPDDLAKGQSLLEEIVKISKPNVPHYVYNNLGYVLMARAGRYDPGDPALYIKAREYLQLTLAAEPRQKFALANLGNVERLLGRPDVAVRRYEEAIEIDPTYANGWAEMAGALQEADREDDARRAFARALELTKSEGHRSEVGELYARALFRTGHTQEALGLGQQALSWNPVNASLADWLARVAPKASA